MYLFCNKTIFKAFKQIVDKNQASLKYELKVFKKNWMSFLLCKKKK